MSQLLIRHHQHYHILLASIVFSQCSFHMEMLVSKRVSWQQSVATCAVVTLVMIHKRFFRRLAVKLNCIVMYETLEELNIGVACLANKQPVPFCNEQFFLLSGLIGYVFLKGLSTAQKNFSDCGANEKIIRHISGNEHAFAT